MKYLNHDIFQFSWTFERPIMFWWLLLIPAIIGMYIFFRYFSKTKINFSSNSDLEELSVPFNTWKYILLGVQMVGLISLITAMAGPIDKEAAESFEKKYSKGIDIVLAMDVSASMLAQDFKPDRLSVSIEKAIEFINERPSDRIGLSVYEGESYMKVPVTSDHPFLKTAVLELMPGQMLGGTAIGMGLGTAVNGLLDSDAKSKVVILLTDGVNNRGSLEPLEAAKIAETYNIKVYTIGIGSNSASAPMPVTDIFGRRVLQNVPVELDEEILKEIAEITGGKYFRAIGEQSLGNIYKEIDQMEKSNTKVLDFTIEPPYRFHIFVILGIILFFTPIVINYTLLKSIV